MRWSETTPVAQLELFVFRPARAVVGEQLGTTLDLCGERCLNAWLSCTFAPDTAAAGGSPWASDGSCSSLPFLSRSTGFGPVSE
ncbi:hypothetical protein [Streptomyces sp. NPDC001948]